MNELKLTYAAVLLLSCGSAFTDSLAEEANEAVTASSLITEFCKDTSDTGCATESVNIFCADETLASNYTSVQACRDDEQVRNCDSGTAWGETPIEVIKACLTLENAGLKDFCKNSSSKEACMNDPVHIGCYEYYATTWEEATNCIESMPGKYCRFQYENDPEFANDPEAFNMKECIHQVVFDGMDNDEHVKDACINDKVKEQCKASNVAEAKSLFQACTAEYFGTGNDDVNPCEDA